MQCGYIMKKIMDLTRKKNLWSDRLHQLVFLNCDTVVSIRFSLTSRSRGGLETFFGTSRLGLKGWTSRSRLGLEGWTSRSRLGLEGWTSRSRLGLEGWRSRFRLGLESLKKWNVSVSVSSRSCDLTSCGHPCCVDWRRYTWVRVDVLFIACDVQWKMLWFKS